MFVFNFKINKKRFMTIFKSVIIFLSIVLLLLTIYSIFKKPDSPDVSQSQQPAVSIDLGSGNYTSFLKDCHDNINKYIDAQITATGYVYRLPDFNSNQFVLARTMLINSNSQAVVVGILCECENAQDFENYDWVKVTGTIFKGDYNGPIPEVNISEIQKTNVPEDELVYEPVD